MKTTFELFSGDSLIKQVEFDNDEPFQFILDRLQLTDTLLSLNSSVRLKLSEIQKAVKTTYNEFTNDEVGDLFCVVQDLTFLLTRYLRDNIRLHHGTLFEDEHFLYHKQSLPKLVAICSKLLLITSSYYKTQNSVLAIRIIKGD